MSEPTYRITLTHDPASGAAVCWTARVYIEAEYDEDDSPCHIYDTFAATREAAFDHAQAWCKAKASEPEAPSTVFLTQDGELFDRHELAT